MNRNSLFSFAHSPLFLLLIVVAAGCDVYTPAKPFDPSAVPPAPDYAALSSWSCLPDKVDYADMHPASVEPGRQTEAMADVFFLHPTTFMESDDWNADIHNEAINHTTDERAIKHQASIFNEAGRVFAPRYRQMVYGGYFSDDSVSKAKASAVAYQDIKAAFEYYLANWNEGRPIILAGHSQGSMHGMRLLKEYFDGTPLQQQLVAAYLPGWPIREDLYESIPACNSPEQTGCVASWCSYKDGYEPESIHDFYQDAIVTNPLNWRSDGTPATEDLHQGFLMENYEKFYKHAVNTSKHEGILWVTSPIPLVPIKNYHVGDFNLFWLDVRENAAQRVTAFQSVNGHTASH